MSSSTYYVFGVDGTLRDERKMRNASGSAPPIWQALQECAQ